MNRPTPTPTSRRGALVRRIGIGALTGLALPAWAAPEDTGGPVEPASIVNGEETGDYPSAIAIGFEAFGFRQSTCSASLITDRILLTAAHCTEEFVKQGVQEDLIVEVGAAFLGRNVERADTVKFEDFRNHPRYEGITGLGTPENDYGVVILAEPVRDIQPVWFRTEPLTDDDVGKRLVSVGYGITSAATQSGSGVKRKARIRISELDGQYIVSYSADNPGNGNVCSGDSGGPQYFERDDGTLEQWSVHSWADQGCTFVSGSARTDVMADWILKQVEEVHGTTEVCEVQGLHDNGVCDEGCDADPECGLAGGGDGDGSAGGGGGGGEACGCTTVQPGALTAAFPALLMALGLRRRRS